MRKQKIETPHAPAPIGPYSQAIQAHPFLFLSGVVPIDPQTGKITASGIEAQTRQVLQNIKAILKEAGLDFQDVVKVEIFLKEMGDFARMNAIYAEAFCHDPKPARHAFQVAKLPMDALLEITCTALCK